MTTTLELPPLQVTIREAARLLSFNERTIRNLIAKGELKATGNGRGRRVTMESIKRHMDESQN